MDNESAYINSVNLNLCTEFPYLVLNIESGTSKPLNPGFHVMHWHEDLQFIYVLDGHISVKTLEDEAEVIAGEGIFINKKVVHLVESTEHDRYKSFVFPDYFVSFYFGSPAAKLTQKITSNTQIRLIAIRQNSSWGDCAIPLLQQLVALESNKDEFYGYEVLVRLSRLWLLLLKNVEIPEVLTKNVTAFSVISTSTASSCCSLAFSSARAVVSQRDCRTSFALAIIK